MKRARSGRAQTILDDPNVLGWFESIRLRSPLSAAGELRKLALLCHRLKTTPEQLARDCKRGPDNVTIALVKLATDLKKAGLLDSYIAKSFSAMKRWLEFRGVRFDRYPKLHVVQGLSIRDEVVPGPDQLGRILAALPLRWRAAALLMAHSGLRPGVLCLHPGVPRTVGNPTVARALQMKHLPELLFERGKPEFSRLPFRINVPEELSKTARSYVTFGSPEAAKTLGYYLAERINAGEKLGRETPVIGGKLSGEERESQGGFITTETLTYALRTAMRSVFPEEHLRPYVLRSYASLRMLSAEQQTGGRITRDGREAMLGHDLGVSGRYNLSKKLSDDTVESLRAQYSFAVPFLETSSTDRLADPRLTAYKLLVLSAVGYSEKEAAELAKLPEEEMREVVRERRPGGASVEPVAVPGPPGLPPARSQRIVSISEAENMLQTGWVVVAGVGDRMVVQTGR